MGKTAVYGIKDFDKDSGLKHFYINKLGPHVKEHSFTALPHKHDFYLFMVVTKGSGIHEIDFAKYPVKAGSVFLMQPGQMHFWKFSKDIDGFVFFHSRQFYEEGYTHTGIHQFPFFSSFQNTPYVHINKKNWGSLEGLCYQMQAEFRTRLSFRYEKIRSLINLVYIDVTRVYQPKEYTKGTRYRSLLNEFEKLIEENFRENKLPGHYASTLNITEKHLNRICRETVDKTSTQIIADRVVLEAKRLLSQQKQNITEVGFELGFNDPSYFIRFFKKHADETPLSFQRKFFTEY